MASLTLAFSSEPAAAALLSIGVRSIVVLVAAWVAVATMRRASAGARHMVWLAAMVALLVLPALSVLPGWRVIRADLVTRQPALDTLVPRTGGSLGSAGKPTPASVAAVPGQPDSAPVSSGGSVSVSAILIGLWAVGVVLSLVPAVLGRVLLRRDERGAAPASDPRLIREFDLAAVDLGLSRRVALLVGVGPGMPMAWGILRPRILLPGEAADWSRSQVRAALIHELAHIKRHDCATLLLAQIVRALYWCNPLVWLTARRLHAERERACDDMVLAAGTGGPDYARDLLLVAAGRSLGITAAAAMAMARPSHLEGRITAILDGTRRRERVTQRQMLAATAVAALLIVPITSLRGAEASSTAVQPAGQALVVQPGIRECCGNALRLTTMLAAYAQQQDDHLPPDLGALFGWATQRDHQSTPKETAKLFLCPSDHATMEIPEIPTAEWINQHTSYVLLAAGAPWSKIPDPGRTALVHERFDRGHVVKGPEGGEQRVLVAGLAIGCGTPSTEAHIRGLVEESSKVFEALRAGTAFPDSHQIMWDLRQIWEAVNAYAKDHGGELPPDLGSTLTYVPTDPQRAATPAQKAAAYLSPAAKRATQIPEAPTPEWIDQHASYVYLGGPGLRLSKIPDHMETLILHARPEDAFTMRGVEGTQLLPTISLRGDPETFGEKMGRAAIEDSKHVLEAVRTGGPLPDHHQAQRDLQILLDAAMAYAKEHDGRLPPDLGATLPYIKTDLLPADTVAEQARVYLSPPTEKAVQLPAQLTPDWVNRHATYVYEGDGLTLKQAQHASQFILIHPDPREEYWAPKGGDGPVLPLAYAFGFVGSSSREVALTQIETTKAAAQEIRTPTK